MKKETPYFSIIIAGYNEEKKIGQTLKKIIVLFDKKKKKYGPYEIIFVDDGSTDKTLEVARNISNIYPHIRIIGSFPNKGKGFAIKKGMSEAKGNLFIVTDADFAYSFEEIDNFFDVCSVYDMAVGTRIHSDSTYVVNYTSFKLIFFRHVMSRLFNAFVQLLFKIPQKDKQCGLKVMRGHIGKEIAEYAKINGFSYDVELFLIAQKRKNSIIELPVQVKYSDTDSNVRVWKHAPLMFLELLTIKYNELKGVYDQR